MSKAKKGRAQNPDQPRRSQPDTACAFPAVASYLSWVSHISEDEAQKTVNILAKFSDPKRGKLQFDRCESPAERLFLLGGNLTNDFGISIQFASPEQIGQGVDNDHSWIVGELVGEISGDRFKLFQQYVVGDYRVDFCVPELRLAIEVDGHDFHERTKEQAAADKQRDRALAMAGYRVIRFTGSEIYADPNDAVVECMDVAISLNSIAEEASYSAFSRGVDQGYEDGYEAGQIEGEKSGYAKRGLALVLREPQSPVRCLPSPDAEAAE